MPRVKIDYIVSFSSEDKENPANNLLSWEINKKKWLCKEWEPSCSIVLQLAKAVQIESVNIGVHHAALVEVLVGLSEKPNDPFEVLVPSCVFVSASDSRRGDGVERVRGFSGDQLSDKRAGRWDRVRVVCSQPYNKRVQYGLTFVHIHSKESDGSGPQKAVDHKTNLDPVTKVADPQGKAAAGPLSRLLGLDAYSSDDDDFRPGELFAQRNNNTDAQIRQASSQALNNINNASTKLVKTPIAKTNRQSGGQPQTDRKRDSLLYTEDDDRPNDRIDRLVQNHRTEQERAKKRNPDRELKDSGRAKRERIEEDRSRHNDKPKTEKVKDKEKDKTSNGEVQNRRNEKEGDSSNSNKDTKRNDKGVDRRAATSAVVDTPKTKTNAGGSDVLAGVVFSISGYEQPRRGRVRDAALALGARYEPHALQRCTHLVCAFPNTPKLRELRRVNPGARAVRAEWVEHAAAARRRPPEAPYAPDKTPPPAPSSSPPPVVQSPPPAAPSPPLDVPSSPPAAPSPPLDVPSSPKAVTSPPAISDADTDDEIERAMLAGAGAEGDDDDGADTEPDEPPPKCDNPKHLPALFAGRQVVLEAGLGARTATQLARYLRAYGALVLQADEVLDEGCIDYVVMSGAGWGGAPAARRVPPQWVWRCHRKQKLCSTD
ncbi:DNA repair protein XRCC1 [Aricia agestis]|uniref:DNA repair protein XRCC1 n=1 Tax=Aricia agestis TaxID=91739 RepID=UPI001C209E69|nr:DNA repair protein XRCC1 [Aricia agestis]